MSESKADVTTIAVSSDNSDLRLRSTDRSLPIALLRARETVISRFRPLLAANGFTEQQWRVLRVLEELGPSDPTFLSERCCVLTPSMTRILRTLETRGLIKRTRHDQDLRKYIISITNKGKKVINDLILESNRIYQKLEMEFGKQDTDQLLDMLERLASLNPD